VSGHADEFGAGQAARRQRRFSRRALVAESCRLAGLVSVALGMPMLPKAFAKSQTVAQTTASAMALPSPDQAGRLSVEAALATRRSVREFATGSLTLGAVSQLLWAAQGITSDAGYRTAPSAGALYPLLLHLVAGDVEALAPGIYRYGPQRHSLETVAAGDRRAALVDAALSQHWIADAAAVIAVAAIPARTTRKYGERGRRFVLMEAGHAAQNICLQAVSLGLGATPVGAFRDEAVKNVLQLAAEAEPIYLIPVGKR
jgi:SagB-type dehydrogenase family enzyme